MKNKMGFTLIELLIIVLIIGILAAIALPQYQTAVDKSRYAGLMPMGKSLADAQEIYHAANGSYSGDFSELDAIPGNPGGSSVSLSDGMSASLSDTDGYDYVKIGKDGLNNYYVVYQEHSKNYAKDIHCEAFASSDRAIRLCLALGGREIPGNTTAGYKSYVLEGMGEGTPHEMPTQGDCVVNTTREGCARYFYLDGSSYETYMTASGNAVTMNFDANGAETYRKSVKPNGDVVERWSEGGVPVRQLQSYANGQSSDFYLYANNNVEHAVYQSENATATIYLTEDGKGKEIINEMSTNGEIVHSYFNEDGTVSYTTASWYNEDNDKIRYYNDYSDPDQGIQTQYYEDGSIRGYWMGMGYSFEVSAKGGFSYSWDSASEGTYYNRDGSLNYSESTESSGLVRYEYSSDGTYVRKPENTTDSSLWTYGTYTDTGTNGDILRDDGVTVPGRGNYPTLCDAHPTMPQCGNN